MSEAERPRTLALHFRRSHRLFLLTLAACTAITAITAIGTMIVVTKELPSASQAALAQRSASRSVEAALEQQSNFRGYLLSGDDRFRTRYRASSEAFLAANRELTNALQSKHLAALLIDSRVSHEKWETLANQYLAQQSPELETRSVASSTAPLFDAYRVDADELIQAVSDQRVYQARRFFIAAGLPTALVFISFVTGLVLLSREHGRLKTLVIEPIAELETAARKAAEGEVDIEIGPTGVADFRQLGEDLNTVTRALAEERERAQATIENAGEESNQLRHLLEFARAAGSHASLSELQAFLCEESRRLTAATCVTLIDRLNDGELRVVCSSGDIDLQAHDAKLVERAVMIGRTTKTHDSIVVPLVHAGQVIAILQFFGDSALMDEQLVELIGVQSGSALEVARAHEEAEYLSEHDPLTGVLNRRRFDADLDLELSRAARYGSPVSLMMIDIDYFKSINDQHGHHFGDHVLRSVASALSESLRVTDSAYRYGGEEFAVIARETDLKGVLPVATRLRNDVQRQAKQVTSIDVTLSIGVASSPEVGHGTESLISRADAGLYKAKELGRDRVIAARLAEFMEVP